MQMHRTTHGEVCTNLYIVLHECILNYALINKYRKRLRALRATTMFPGVHMITEITGITGILNFTSFSSFLFSFQKLMKDYTGLH